ncbi:ABC transporter substrate-binding protein [Acuticoccus sp. M5D2P5]|uniref:ABC transporter substrate-binding protein n=1 Tax=Acuticoccus kalidii TaxID=2910977 RepID=UPI001F19C651|nr:ABC transporter substrate-binding protein [Acuticoccus kalidii]MCF3934857.1 ABC transporter substrate-binding protein [Acuticoccus kalidii]
MIHQAIKDYNASQDEYRIEPRVLPFVQLQTELIKAVATGDVPDLITVDNPVLVSLAAQGALEDLTDLVSESENIDPEVYVEGPWRSNVWRDQIYGVPRDANTIGVYYNKDMFREAGLDPESPPATWDELRDAAQTLAGDGVNGIAFSAIMSEEGPFQWLPFLYQAGGSLDNINSPEAVEALQFWVDLVESGSASPDVVNMRQYEAANTFMAGNAAMAISGPWELPRIEQEADFDWSLALLPVKADKNIRASALGGYNWAIPAGAENVDGAFEFIEFMSRQDVLQNGWDTGRLPPRTDITVPDPRWPEAFATFNEQLQTAIPRGPHPRWPEISKALQIAIQEALTGRKSAQDALDSAAATINPILQETPL